MQAPFGPHSALGTVAAALVVMVGVVLQGKNFDSGTIYRTALPLMAGALIIPSALGLFNSSRGNFSRHRRLYGILDSHHADSGQHLLPLRRFGDMALRH